MAITINGSGTVTGLSVGGLPDGTVDSGTLATDSVTAVKIPDTVESSLKSGRKNLIINGGFDVWQRGTSFTGTSSTYTSDRWFAYLSGNVGFTVVKPSLTTLGNALEITSTSAGYGVIATVVENTSRLTGTYTLSFYIKSNVSGNNARIELRQNTSTNTIWQDTAYAAIGTTWTKVTKTIVLDETDDMRILIGQHSGSSATLQIAQVQLELGSVATDFEHRSYGEELALCQRYFYLSQDQYYYTTEGGGIKHYYFPTTMRANPTVTLTSSPTGMNVNRSRKDWVTLSGASASGSVVLTTDAEM